ncbi:MAG: DUF4157 domain-containing protein [Nitrospiraceae bacterium]
MSGACAECSQRRLLGKPLQAKLRLNEPGDVYEQEADRVAEQVMRMPDSDLNRPRHDAASLLVQRRSTAGSTGAAEAPPIVHDVLNSSGQPLDEATRAFFEPRFGHDFGNVRVHADASAAESARVVNAQAYTVGRNMVFGAGRYVPTTEAGQRLLAHELTHVFQQMGNDHGRTLQRAPGTGAETGKEVVPGGLSTGLASTHEIVIEGEAFDLAVMANLDVPESPSAKFRAVAEEYMGSYPNLGAGPWAFIIKQGIVPPGDKPYCPIGGNCLGWAYGGARDVDPSERVWALVPAYFESIGLTGAADAASQATYLSYAKGNRFPAHAIWDYFMNTEFQAVPADNDATAHMALYGRGFSGSMDGPSHIAFRTAGGEIWVSKPSPFRYPLVHEQANQMAGGETGEVVRLYARASGPLNRAVLRPKQTQGGPPQ